MIDCSHANSQKQHEQQVDVARDVAAQIAGGDARIFGVMIESHLNPGRQDLVPGQPLQYGVSITDACIGWDATVDMLHVLAEAVRQRRLRLTDERRPNVTSRALSRERWRGGRRARPKSSSSWRSRRDAAAALLRHPALQALLRRGRGAHARLISHLFRHGRRHAAARRRRAARAPRRPAAGCRRSRARRARRGAGGLSARAEFEWPVAGPHLDPLRFATTPFRRTLGKAEKRGHRAALHDRHHAHDDSARVSRQHDGAAVHRRRRGRAPRTARPCCAIRSHEIELELEARRRRAAVRARACARRRRAAGVRTGEQGGARLRVAATAHARAGARHRCRLARQSDRRRRRSPRSSARCLAQIEGNAHGVLRRRRSGVDPSDAHRRAPPARLPFAGAQRHGDRADRAAAGRVALARAGIRAGARSGRVRDVDAARGARSRCARRQCRAARGGAGEAGGAAPHVWRKDARGIAQAAVASPRFVRLVLASGRFGGRAGRRRAAQPRQRAQIVRAGARIRPAVAQATPSRAGGARDRPRARGARGPPRRAARGQETALRRRILRAAVSEEARRALPQGAGRAAGGAGRVERRGGGGERLAGELAGPQSPAAAAFSGWAAARSAARSEALASRLDRASRKRARSGRGTDCNGRSGCSNPPKSAIGSRRASFAREVPKLREALLNTQFELAQATARPDSAAGQRRRGRRPRRNREQAERMDGPAPHPRHYAFGPRTRGRARAPAGVALLARAAAARKDRHLHERVVSRARASRAHSIASTDTAFDGMLHEIRQYEQMLTAEGIVLLKFWIHLSRADQKKRLEGARSGPARRAGA